MAAPIPATAPRATASPPPPPGRTGRPLAEHGAVAALYLVGTALLTWPWLARFGTHVVGVPGDNWEFLWKLWWVPHRIAAGAPVFFAAHVFPQAGGYDLGTTDMSPVPSFLLAPLTAAAGPVVTYNTAMVLSFVLAGVGTYVLARRLGAGRVPAFLAGAAFAWSPFHFVQGLAHLNVAQIGFTPWVFVAADVLLERRRVRDGVWLGVATALAALTTWYRLVFLVATVPFFAVIRMRQLGVPLRHLLAPVGVAAATAAVVVVPFAVPVLTAGAAGDRPPFLESAYYELSPTDWLTPPPGHPVADWWVDDLLRDDNGERIVYPGAVVLALAAVAVVHARTRRRVVPLAAVAAVAVVMSLGPVLRWFGEPVVVRRDGPVSGPLHRVAVERDPHAPPEASAVPLPVYLVSRYVPVLGGLRTWARAAELGILAFDVMAAVALTALLGRSPSSGAGRLRRVLSLAGATAVLALVVADSWSAATRGPLSHPAPRPVDRWLAALPGDPLVIQLPWRHGQSGVQVWYSIFHGKPIALAQASLIPEPVQRWTDAIEDGFPYRPEWVGVLRTWGIRYVIVDEALDEPIPQLRQAMAGHGLRVATRQGSVTVFEVPPAAD